MVSEDDVILNNLMDSVASIAGILQKPNEEVRERIKFLIENYWTPLTSIKYYMVKDEIIYLATTMSSGYVSIDTIPLDDARELYDEMPEYIDGNVMNDMLDAKGYKHIEGIHLLRIMSLEFGGQVQGGGRGKKITFVKSESKSQSGGELPTEGEEETEYAEAEVAEEVEESGMDTDEPKVMRVADDGWTEINKLVVYTVDDKFLHFGIRPLNNPDSEPNKLKRIPFDKVREVYNNIPNTITTKDLVEVCQKHGVNIDKQIANYLLQFYGDYCNDKVKRGKQDLILVKTT